MSTNKRKWIFCEHCGNTMCFYTKESYKGTCNTYFRTDDYEPDNTCMYDNAENKLRSKFIYCADCDRKVCKVEDVVDLKEW